MIVSLQWGFQQFVFSIHSTLITRVSINRLSLQCKGWLQTTPLSYPIRGLSHLVKVFKTLKNICNQALAVVLARQLSCMYGYFLLLFVFCICIFVCFVRGFSQDVTQRRRQSRGFANAQAEETDKKIQQISVKKKN